MEKPNIFTCLQCGEESRLVINFGRVLKCAGCGGEFRRYPKHITLADAIDAMWGSKLPYRTEGEGKTLS